MTLLFLEAVHINVSPENAGIFLKCINWYETTYLKPAYLGYYCYPVLRISYLRVEAAGRTGACERVMTWVSACTILCVRRITSTTTTPTHYGTSETLPTTEKNTHYVVYTRSIHTARQTRQDGPVCVVSCQAVWIESRNSLAKSEQSADRSPSSRDV